MTIKQYVNLPNDQARHYGRSVSLKVTTRKLGSRRGQADWWVEPVGGNNVDSKYLSSPRRAHTLHRYTPCNNGKSRNVLKLPHAGGDKYVVKCAKRGKRSNAIALEEIETWRKIFFTVHYMNAACQAMFTSVEADFIAAFNPGFIELERVGFNTTLVDEPSTRSSNVLPHLYRRVPALADKPWHARIVVLNNIYDPATVTLDQVLTGVGNVTFAVPDNELDDQQANSWLVSATASIEPGGAIVDVSANATKTGTQAVRVNLAGLAPFDQAIAAGQQVRVTVTVNVMEAYLGHSIGNFCCVRIREDPARARTIILQTFTHEIGHGLQQVVKRERIHDAHGVFTNYENNPMWYTDEYGGQGPHCHTNAKLVASAKTTSRQVYVHDAGTMCTMYHADDAAVDAAGAFCDQCKARLRRVDLGRSKMNQRNWGRY